MGKKSAAHLQKERAKKKEGFLAAASLELEWPLSH
jgi:hypothetical protein